MKCHVDAIVRPSGPPYIVPHTSRDHFVIPDAFVEPMRQTALNPGIAAKCADVAVTGTRAPRESVH